jgi:hypothetical protein
MKSYKGIFGLVLLAVAVVASTVMATQIEYVSPRQMGEESGLVVRGEVSGVRSFWNDTHTKVFTETVVRVDETYKGAGGATVRILQLGGVVDKIRMHVHGALSWRSGEEVVLFLDPLDQGRYRVAGFSQGKFNVERDPVTGAAYITRPALEGAEILGAPPRTGGAPVSRPMRVPLDEFVNHALGHK